MTSCFSFTRIIEQAYYTSFLCKVRRLQNEASGLLKKMNNNISRRFLNINCLRTVLMVKKEG